jgi:hypothetical protein
MTSFPTSQLDTPKKSTNGLAIRLTEKIEKTRRFKVYKKKENIIKIFLSINTIISRRN